jgi:hypothetical protein
MPALLVFLFVKIFKKQLAANPTKNQLLRYVVIYLLSLFVICIVLFAITKLIT